VEVTRHTAEGEERVSEQLSLDGKQRLLKAMLRLRDIHSIETRALYVAELETHLGEQLSVTRDPDTRRHLISLINACAVFPNGMATLTEIIRVFEGETVAMIDLERLVAELLVTQADRAELYDLVAAVPTERIAAAFHDLAEPEAMTPQPNWHDVAAVMNRVESFGEANGEPPALFRFVDRLAHDIEGGRSMRLHQWIDRVGSRTGLDQAAIRSLCVATTTRLEEGRLPATQNASSYIFVKNDGLPDFAPG
jgi:hypothetical protein